LLRSAGVGAQWQVLVQPGEIRIIPVAVSDAQPAPEDRRTVNWTAQEAGEQARLLRQIHEELRPYTVEAWRTGLEAETENWEALLG
jgi:hypothetical protein